MKIRSSTCKQLVIEKKKIKKKQNHEQFYFLQLFMQTLKNNSCKLCGKMSFFFLPNFFFFCPLLNPKTQPHATVITRDICSRCYLNHLKPLRLVSYLLRAFCGQSDPSVIRYDQFSGNLSAQIQYRIQFILLFLEDLEDHSSVVIKFGILKKILLPRFWQLFSISKKNNNIPIWELY